MRRDNKVPAEVMLAFMLSIVNTTNRTFFDEEMGVDKPDDWEDMSYAVFYMLDSYFANLDVKSNSIAQCHKMVQSYIDEQE